METINHEYYVSLDVAKLLKKAGFDWKVRYMYRNNNPILCICTQASYRNTPKPNKCPMFWQHAAPALDVTQRWLREVKGIHICVKPNEASANCKYFVTVIVNDTKWGNIQDDNRKTIMFDTYEEAQEAGIKKALELILEKGE